MREPEASAYKLSKREIDLISEALKIHINYYKGWICVKQAQKETQERELSISYIKAKIRELEALQEKTTYIGQSDIYK